MRYSFYARYSLRIMLAVVFLMPFAVIGAIKAKAHNRNDVKEWLPKEYDETKTYAAFRKMFEGEEFILVSWDGCTLSDQRLDLMADKLVPPEDQRSPNDPASYYHTVLTGPRLLARMTSDEIGLPYEVALERLTGSLIGPANGKPDDERITCLVLTLSELGRENLRQSVGHIVTVANQCNITYDALHMGGPPVDNVAIDTVGEQSLNLLAGLSFVIGTIVSWWTLRTGRLVAMVLFAGVYSMALSLSIVWFTGHGVNAILLTMPSLVYVATTSGAIHLANYYKDVIHEGVSPRAAPTAAIAHAWLPLSLATGTTAVGLLTLCYSELVPIQMFGFYSAIGVVVALMLLFFFMPAALQLWPPKIKDSSGDHDPTWHRPEDSRWWRIGQAIVRNHVWVGAGCLLVMAAIGYGMTKVESSVQLMRLFTSDAKILKDYAWLETNLGPLVPMEIQLEVPGKLLAEEREKENQSEGQDGQQQAKVANDPGEPRPLTFLERMELVGKVQQNIESIHEVGSTMSTLTFAPELKVPRVIGGPRVARSVLNKQLLRNKQKFLKEDYLREIRRPDGQVEKEIWRISARVSATKNVDYLEFIQELRVQVDPVVEETKEKTRAEELHVVYTGLVPLVYKAQHSLLDGLIFGLYTDFLLIVIVMMILTRSFSAGIILLIPSAFPAVVVFGSMGWLGVMIDIGTVMAPSVALGVTVDDIVHFMLWFRRGIQDGMSRQQAVMLAYKGCARAMYQSWGVIGLGLSVFAFSPFTPTQRFGMMMLTMLTAALAGNLLLLPSLLAGPLGGLFERSIRRRMERRLRHRATVDQEPEAVGAGTSGLQEPHRRTDPAHRGSQVTSGQQSGRE